MSLRATKFRGDQPIVDQQGRPTIPFLRQLNSNVDVVSAIAAALEAADIALAAAETAQAAADGATSESSLNSSYPANFVAPLVSANAAGNVVIANHDRIYGDGTSVAVTGTVLTTGLPVGTVVRVYYDDPTRAGGAVPYQYTSDPTVAAQSGVRHSVGAVTIPNAGTSPGNPVLPPGTAIP